MASFLDKTLKPAHKVIYYASAQNMYSIYPLDLILLKMDRRDNVVQVCLAWVDNENGNVQRNVAIFDFGAPKEKSSLL